MLFRSYDNLLRLPQFQVFSRSRLGQQDDLSGVHGEVLDDVIDRLENRDVVLLYLAPAQQGGAIQAAKDFVGLPDGRP